LDGRNAISVTLRSTATPEENSTTPKNNAGMTGTIMVNSIAAMPTDFQRKLLRQRTTASRHPCGGGTTGPARMI
jgi:DNA-binding NtrC family response regulator